MTDRPPELERPLFVGRLAMLALLVLTFGLTLVRVDVTDTPWHLATARLAFETGKWPTRNTFSWTHPDYPLQQQYPVYQSVLYAVQRWAGFEGLSVFQAIAWTSIFVLAVHWGGGWRHACSRPELWMLGLLGLQRRMTLRPDIGTFAILFCMFVLADLYRRGRLWAAIGLVFLQWLFANAHQLFPVGIAVQCGLLAEVAASRVLPKWFATPGSDSPKASFFAGIAGTLPIWPMAAALVASCAACLLTPLGWEIIYTPLHTADSLAHHREYLQEFRPIWTDSYALQLSLLCGLCTLVAWTRSTASGARRPIAFFDLWIWLLAGALAASAVRGAALFCIVSIGVCMRRIRDNRNDNVPSDLCQESRSHIRSIGRGADFILALAIIATAGNLLAYRWRPDDRDLMAFQPGVGKWRGWWPSESVRFLRDHPPPGRMLNLGWFAANSLIWELYPGQQVFVDPRFEAFPRAFLMEAIEAEEKFETLNRLLEEHRPGWLVGEVRLEEVCNHAGRLLQNDAWRLVVVDDVFFVLVRNDVNAKEYFAGLPKQDQTTSATRIDEAEPPIACRQRLNLARFFAALSAHNPNREDLLLRAVAECRRARELGERQRGFGNDLSEVEGRLAYLREHSTKPTSTPR